MASVADTFASPKFQRYLLWFGLAVLVAGAIVLVVVIRGGSGDSTKADTVTTVPAESAPLRNADGTVVKTYEQLDPQIRAAVTTFVGSAVARQHVGRSWDVVAPSLKAGYTRSEWAKGELPVVPYPGVDTERVRYSLDHASTKQILVEVGLIGKPGVRSEPETFQLGLVPVNGRWLVDYWAPRGAPVPG
jgi:hypothetical protein